MKNQTAREAAPARMSALGVTLALIAATLALPSVCAAQDTTDCSKCDITNTQIAGHHADQTACPGANAVVCDYTYSKQTKAECKKNGYDLRNCKPVEKDMKYTATKHVGVICATLTTDAQGNTTNNCPAGTGATMEITRKGWTCEGLPWLDALPIDIAQAYVLDLATRNGTTTLSTSVATKLNNTVVTIPTVALQQALEEGLLQSDGEFAYLTLTIAFEQPTRFLFAGNALRPAPLTDGLEVDSSIAVGATAEIELRLPVSNLGAFAGYALDFAGTRVFPGPAQSTSEDAQTGSTGVSSNEVSWLISLSSRGEPLISGAGTVGRTAAALLVAPATLPTAKN